MRILCGMTILCSGWKRLSPTMAVHDPRCSWASSSDEKDCTHGMSPECLKLYRISNGLPTERALQEEIQ